MNFDIPHMIVTGIIIFVVIYGLEHSGFVDGVSKLRRGLIVAAVLFVILLILNLVRPYGGAGGAA